jgi:hypothetical protein
MIYLVSIKHVIHRHNYSLVSAKVKIRQKKKQNGCI